MYGIGPLNPWHGMATPQTNDGINNLIDPEIQKQDELSWANNEQVKWKSGFRAMKINFLENLMPNEHKCGFIRYRRSER